MKPLIANNQVLVRNQYRTLFLKRFDKKYFICCKSLRTSLEIFNREERPRLSHQK
jgi:hypothetical protein